MLGIHPICCLTGGPLDNTDIEGTAEAEHAAAKAHDTTDEPDSIVDALEAAEAKYDEQHPEEAAGLYKLSNLNSLHIICSCLLNKMHHHVRS